MWFQLALYPDAPLLGVMVGSDNLLYFRTIDLGHLLGKKYGFGKQFPYDIVFGKDVLPRTQTYPRYTANARLVTQDIAYRILCREHRELAERLSNAFDSGYAYVQGKRTFELTYKNSPRLLVVNTPHENTVKVSHWIRDFMLDVERQRATELFRLVASESPGYNETMEATREIARENIESTQEMHRECTQEMHETMEVGENPMGDEENGIAARPDPMGDEENGIAVGQDSMSDGENDIAASENEMGDEENGIAVGQDENAAGWENLFQVVNESAFKSYFNNVQDLGESFIQLPQTIHITRSLNPRIMVVVPDE